MMTSCTREGHEAVKLDDAQWKALRPGMPQEDGDGGWLEMRHCRECGSSLLRPYEGLRIRHADDRHVTVSCAARVSGTATRHEWSNLAPRIFVHGEASDPHEAAVMAYIAAMELRRAEPRPIRDGGER